MANESKHLRALASSGESYDNPSEDSLFMLFEDMHGGTEEFFILERLSDPSGETYAQTIRCTGGSCECKTDHAGEWWTVEQRDGGPDKHWATGVDSYRKAFAILANWAFGHPPAGEEMPEHDWSQVEF